MFQVELLSGGVFIVYAVDTAEDMFLIYRDDQWNWIGMEKCKPYAPPWMGHLDDAPSVDAVSVVRCKDCKYFGRELENGKHDCTDCNLPYCRPDDFCSYGVQKEAKSTDE